MAGHLHWKQRRARLFIRWTSTTACLLLLAAYIASAWYQLRVRGPAGYFGGIGLGQINFGRNVPTPPMAWSLGRHYFGYFGLNWGYRCVPIGSSWVAFVPLWPVLILTAAATAALWVCLRPPPRGHCPRCGYNLAGLGIAACPECGAGSQAVSEPRP
jgi:hypothetical protein